MRALALGTALFVFGSAAHAQPSPRTGARLEFEVASIKPNRAVTGLMGGSCQGSDNAQDGRGPIAAMVQAAGVRPTAPGRCRFTRVTLKHLIAFAYDIRSTDVERTIAGGPGWLGERQFDVDAKSERVVAVADMRRMMQTLLADRFKLRVHREQREMPGFALTVAPGGPKLRAAAPGTPTGIQQMNGGPLTAANTTMEELAKHLSIRIGRPIDDATHLQGRYSFTLSWTPGPDERGPMAAFAPNLPRPRFPRRGSFHRASGRHAIPQLPGQSPRRKPR